MSCGLESISFWCTGFGQFLILVFVLALVGVAVWQGYLAIKRYNQPRDMSSYVQGYNIPSPVVNVAENGTIVETEDLEEVLEEEVLEEDVLTSDEEEFAINLEEEFEIWLKANGLEDYTNMSIIAKFFQFGDRKEISINGYDSENDLVEISTTLCTGEMVSFRLRVKDVDFFKDDTLQNPILEVVFTEDYLAADFETDDSLYLKENLLGIDWDGAVFGDENYERLSIYLSESDYKKMLANRI